MSDFSTDSFLNNLKGLEDGFFQIEHKNGRAYLTVHPAGKGGKAVQPASVFSRMRLFQIQDYSEDHVREVVEEAAETPVDIGAWPESDAEDASVEVDVSPDRMKAAVTLSPPQRGGMKLSAEKIISALKVEGVELGIDEELVQSLAENPKYHRDIIVAEGIRPERGTNGSIKMVADVSAKPELKEDNSGRVNYRDINVIKSVKAGDVLAKRIPASKGRDGRNVYGEIIPAEPGSNTEWKIGENVELSEDGNTLKASITGRPVLESNGTVRVDEVVYLDEVDYSTGNVDFPGTIIVEERIADGFSLKTRGSIVVKKSVGKVYLKADKDIILHGGFMGRGEGTIESGGDIHCRFVEQGQLTSGGSIHILDASMHSDLISSDSIYINNGRGEFIGGEAIAKNTFICNKLGAVVETRTRVMVGTPPEIVKEMENMKAELKNAAETLEKVNVSLNKLNEIQKKRDLNDEELNLRKKLRMVEKKYTSMHEQNEKAYEKAIAGFEPQEGSYVQVLREAYPKVEINLGRGKVYRTGIKPVKMGNCIWLNHSGEIQITSQPPAEYLKKIQKEKAEAEAAENE